MHYLLTSALLVSGWPNTWSLGGHSTRGLPLFASDRLRPEEGKKCRSQRREQKAPSLPTQRRDQRSPRKQHPSSLNISCCASDPRSAIAPYFRNG